MVCGARAGARALGSDSVQSRGKLTTNETSALMHIYRRFIEAEMGTALANAMGVLPPGLGIQTSQSTDVVFRAIWHI